MCETQLSDNVLGIGAHTNFGTIMILLQDIVDNLHVWDGDSSTWIEAVLVKRALIVNLGTLMMRWTKGRYLPNLHRVIDKRNEEIYSVSFFFCGIQTSSSTVSKNAKIGKSEPSTILKKIMDWNAGRYADIYGSVIHAKPMGELSI
jgi:isopenicillin N synthase-like dioxygenase